VAITLTQLANFLAVVRTGSVTAAAEQLKVTQPSVSAALSALSKELAVELTEPTGRSVRPSAAGKAFAPYAADVIGLLDQGRRAAREAAQSASARLRIAAATTAGEYLSGPLIQAFTAEHPDIGLTLEVGNRTVVFERLLDHSVDVALAGRPPSDGRLVGVPFLKNDLVVITTPDDPLAGQRSVRIDDLADRPWLLRESGSGTRAIGERFLGQHDLQPQTLTLGSNDAIKKAVAAGLGVAILSSAAVAAELRAGALATVRIRGGLPEAEWYLLWSAVGAMRPPVEEFISFVQSDAGRSALEAATVDPAAIDSATADPAAIGAAAIDPAATGTALS